jgi:hypothetical protein
VLPPEPQNLLQNSKTTPSNSEYSAKNDTLPLLPANTTSAAPPLFYCYNLSPLTRTIETRILCVVKAILVKQFGKKIFLYRLISNSSCQEVEAFSAYAGYESHKELSKDQ